MFDRHFFAYGTLTITYLVTAGILAEEGAIAHAMCALVAALAYALLCRGSRR